MAFRTPLPPPPKKRISLSDSQLSWKLLRSVFSLLLLLQCVAGSEVRYSNQNSLRPNVARPSSKPNEPTTFCCISSVWTLAGNLRMLLSVENLNGHPYIVLFLLLVCMCVRVCMCYLKTKKKDKQTNRNVIKHGKREQERHKFNQNYGGQKRRPLISSPSMQWITKTQNKTKKKRGNTVTV